MSKVLSPKVELQNYLAAREREIQLFLESIENPSSEKVRRQLARASFEADVLGYGLLT